MHDLKDIIDVAAIAVALSTIMKILPAMAALFSIIWTGIRIYDRLKK